LWCAAVFVAGYSGDGKFSRRIYGATFRRSGAATFGKAPAALRRIKTPALKRGACHPRSVEEITCKFEMQVARR
jgi:hypothetical protein